MPQKKLVGSILQKVESSIYDFSHNKKRVSGLMWKLSWNLRYIIVLMVTAYIQILYQN